MAKIDFSVSLPKMKEICKCDYPLIREDDVEYCAICQKDLE